MVRLRQATLEDAVSIAAIYNYYIETSIITFEEVVIDAREMAERIDAVCSKDLPWYVAMDRNTTLGYAYASPWKQRSAYRFAAEVSVYLGHEFVGRGIGQQLYEAVLGELRTKGFHAAIAGIALPNEASVALHERLEFEKVAHFREVGFKMGRWIDIGYWQLMLKPDRESLVKKDAPGGND